VEDVRPFGDRGLAPGRSRLVRGVECELDVLSGAGRDLREGLSGDRAGILEIVALDRRHPLTADEVLVAGLESDERPVLTRLCVDSHCNSFDASDSAGLSPCDHDATERNVACGLHHIAEATAPSRTPNRNRFAEFKGPAPPGARPRRCVRRPRAVPDAAL